MKGDIMKGDWVYICSKHGRVECEVCLPRKVLRQSFPSNPTWSVNPKNPHPVLTPWMIKKCIRTIMTDAAVEAARRRVHGRD